MVALLVVWPIVGGGAARERRSAQASGVVALCMYLSDERHVMARRDWLMSSRRWRETAGRTSMARDAVAS